MRLFFSDFQTLWFGVFGKIFLKNHASTFSERNQSNHSKVIKILRLLYRSICKYFSFFKIWILYTQIFKVSISAFNRSTCFCRLSSTGSTLTTDTLRRFSSFHVSLEVLIEKFNCLYLAACKIRLNSHSFLSLISAISPADFPRIFLADSSKMVIH